MTGPWTNRLAFKVFLSYLGIVLLLFVLVYLYLGDLVRDFYVSSLAKKMREEAALAGRLLPSSLQGEALDELCREWARDLGVRITVITLTERFWAIPMSGRSRWKITGLGPKWSRPFPWGSRRASDIARPYLRRCSIKRFSIRKEPTNGSFASRSR